MKKIIAMCLMMPTVVFAQPKVETVYFGAYCVSLESLEKALKHFDEVPFVRGVGEREPVGAITTVLFVNPKTRTWTLVEKQANDRYCILSAGDNFEPVPDATRKEIEKGRKGPGL